MFVNKQVILALCKSYPKWWTLFYKEAPHSWYFSPIFFFKTHSKIEYFWRVFFFYALKITASCSREFSSSHAGYVQRKFTGRIRELVSHSKKIFLLCKGSPFRRIPRILWPLWFHIEKNLWHMRKAPRWITHLFPLLQLDDCCAIGTSEKSQQLKQIFAFCQFCWWLICSHYTL